jgi:hypothetical protein
VNAFLIVLVDLNLMEGTAERKISLFKLCAKVLLAHPSRHAISPALETAYVGSPFFEPREPGSSSHGELARHTFDLADFERPTSFRRITDAFQPSRHRLLVRGVPTAASCSRFPRVRTITSIDDFIQLVVELPDSLRFSFGLHLRDEKPGDKSLMAAALPLLAGIALGPEWESVARYLRGVQDRRSGNAFTFVSELEPGLVRFFANICAKSQSRYDVVRMRCDQCWQAAIKRVRRYEILSTSADPGLTQIGQTLTNCDGRLENAIRDYRRLMRELCHSWKSADLRYEYVFRSSARGFHSLIKAAPKLSRSPQKVLETYSCKVVKIGSEIQTDFQLAKDRVVLVGYRSFAVSEVQRILQRLRQQRNTALEFFLVGGKSYLVDFAPRTAPEILKSFRFSPFENAPLLQRDAHQPFFQKNGSTAAWTEWRMSTFDYLLELNLFASRSFRDPSSYPIFPWVLLDFTENLLNLENSSIFRDFRYPIFAQLPEQRAILHAKMDSTGPVTRDNAMFFVAPSNPTIIAHWLVRLEPFTSLHLDTESGRFGFSARLFQSLSQSAQAVQISACNWELTPEFFCQSEFLRNLNRLEIGGGIDHVVLPEWSQTAAEFVYLHRKALESDVVSAQIHAWIDLVFGVGTAGQAAFDSCNVCSPLLFADVWQKYGTTPEDRRLVETVLTKSGQYPPPLFDAPHPARSPKPAVRTGKPVVISFDKFPVVMSRTFSGDGKEIKYFVVYDDGSTFFVSAQRGNCKQTQVGEITGIRFSVGPFVVSDRVQILKPNGIEVCNLPAKKLVCAASDENTMVYATRGGQICSLESKICSILYEKVVLMAISLEFDLLVVATLEANVLLYSLSKGVFRFRCDLEGEIATKILITPGWGFVVVLTRNHVHAFNVNGVKIRTETCPSSILCWCAWKSPKGFDCIAAADDKGRLIVCEAFYLRFGESLCFCRGLVVDLSYVSESATLSAVTRDGKCYWVVYSPVE